MKKSYILIALAMVAAFSVAGCKNNNKKTQNQEPTQEKIQAQKAALADSVLAKIDEFADKYAEASADGFTFRRFELTDAERMVKPDYLLDPDEASKFITKSQKVNACAIYAVELFVREIYDMPLEEAKEAIAKLSLDINYPIDPEKSDRSVHSSATVKPMYEKCRENGELNLFWQFSYAILVETGYLLAQNPDLFYDQITEDQWQAFNSRWMALNDAVSYLAQYDDEMAVLHDDFKKKYTVVVSKEDYEKAFSTKESAKQFRIANKNRYIARRNALLQ